MKRTGHSLEKERAAFGCSSRSYCIFNKEKKAEMNDLCNLIKRQNDKDGFVVKENSTYICSKHFYAANIYRAPDGTRHSQSRPKLHS